MTTSDNELSTDECALELEPETIADLDPEHEAAQVKGGADHLKNSHETCV